MKGPLILSFSKSGDKEPDRGKTLRPINIFREVWDSLKLLTVTFKSHVIFGQRRQESSSFSPCAKKIWSLS